jgi:hypothetical protein
MFLVAVLLFSGAGGGAFVLGLRHYFGGDSAVIIVPSERGESLRVGEYARGLEASGSLAETLVARLLGREQRHLAPQSYTGHDRL